MKTFLKLVTSVKVARGTKISRDYEYIELKLVEYSKLTTF